jgi:hypothetical protein
MTTDTQKKQLMGIAVIAGVAAGLTILMSKAQTQAAEGTIEITNLAVSPTTAHKGYPVTISILATNIDSPENTHEFIFSVNGKNVKQTAFIPMGDTVEVSVEYTPNELGDYIVTIGDLYANFTVIEPPAEIGFTVQVINCPVSHRPGAIAKFNDGRGYWIPCGEVGLWPYDANIKQPFPFSIYVYEWVDDTMWDRLGFYSFTALTENGRDYVFDCSNGEFYEV